MPRRPELSFIYMPPLADTGKTTKDCLDAAHSRCLIAQKEACLDTSQSLIMKTQEMPPLVYP